MYSTKSRALISLTVIWLVVRIYPALMGWSSLAANGEVLAAKKLLEYGVLRLHGGVIGWAAGSGIVAHPEHYMYSHHPYLLVWFYTLFYYCFGFAGVSAVMYLLKYVALVLCFLVLDRCFSRSSAFWASVLYAVVPLSIVCDGASNSVIMASIAWPIGLALILFRFHRKESVSLGDLLLAAATTFLAGQTSWFALSVVPSLAVINSRLASLHPRGIRRVLTNPVSLAFLAGGVLSMLVFFGQVTFYEGGLGQLMKFSVFKAGTSVALGPRLYTMGLVPLRIGFFVGLALTLASLLGCLYLAKDTSLANKQPVIGMVLYFTAYGAMVLVAPRAFVEETHFFAWLIVPGAVMAAMLFDASGSKLRKLILALGGLGIVLALLYASVPIANSPTSRYLGKIFAAHSKKTDFIFTNIKLFTYPFKASDIGGGQSTKIVAERFITFGVTDPAQLCLARDLISEDSKFQYWKLRSLPVGAALEVELLSRGKLLRTLSVTFPETTETLTEKLRGFVWYSVMKKGKRPERQRGISSDVMDIYELDMPAITVQEASAR